MTDVAVVRRSPEGPGRRRALRWTAFVCAGTSITALLVHVAGFLPMAFFLTFIGVPSLLLLFTLAAIGRIIRADVFLHCLRLGLVAGFVATLAYDVVRMAAQATQLFDYNAFYAIHVFGGWIMHSTPSSLSATIAGWTYHFWNGLGFGVMYMLTFGRAQWPWGLGYGIFLELIMLGIFPRFLNITDRLGFVVVSLIGHAVFGVVIGVFGQTRGRAWSAG